MQTPPAVENKFQAKKNPLNAGLNQKQWETDASSAHSEHLVAFADSIAHPPKIFLKGVSEAYVIVKKLS